MKYTGFIRPCSHCGGIDLSIEQVNVGPIRIRCKCGAAGPYGKKAQEIIDKWNSQSIKEPVKMVVVEE